MNLMYHKGFALLVPCKSSGINCMIEFNIVCREMPLLGLIDGLLEHNIDLTDDDSTPDGDANRVIEGISL